MKKTILVILVLLSACSSIPKGFDEIRLKEEAQKVIEHLEDLDASWAIDKMRDDLEVLLKEDELKDILNTKYQAVKTVKPGLKFTISDVKDPNTDEVYALVIVERNYESGKGTYTLSFDLNYDLVGLYIK
jgi:hypothetical protein